VFEENKAWLNGLVRRAIGLPGGFSDQLGFPGGFSDQLGHKGE